MSKIDSNNIASVLSLKSLKELMLKWNPKMYDPPDEDGGNNNSSIAFPNEIVAIKTGVFSQDKNWSSFEIAHGLGYIPDFFMIYRIGSPWENDISVGRSIGFFYYNKAKNPSSDQPHIWGMYRNPDSSTLSYERVLNGTVRNGTTIGIYDVTKSTLRVGSSTNTCLYGFGTAPLLWVAIKFKDL